MTDEIIPPGSGADELLKRLDRIADNLERLGDIALNMSCVMQDHSRDICGTIASLHDYQPKPPARGRGRT